jgi:nucleoside-diphosphate-sugar epimerase
MIIVTGHTGFIGNALTSVLADRGMTYRGLSRRTGEDLERVGAMSELEPASWVIHLAGRVDVPSSWEDPAAFYRANMASALAVAEYARRTGSNVLMLSSYLYGSPIWLPIDETHPVQPSNPYARSKAVAEEILTGYAQDFGLPVVIFRVFNLYGPGQPTSQLISHILVQAMESDTISVRDLSPKRDYLWIDDLVSAILKVVEETTEGCHIYNVGSGVSHSVGDIIDCVTSISGRRKIICSDQARPNEIPDCYSDSRKLTEHYNWRPTVSLEAGIARLIELYPSQTN